MARTRLLLPLALAAGLVGGCGGSDTPDTGPDAKPAAIRGEQRGVLDTVDALQHASRTSNGRTICADLFTPRLVRSIEVASDRRCATEVSKHLFKSADAISLGRNIEIRGRTASTVIREQNGNVSELRMLKGQGGWRIDRVIPQEAQ